MNFISQVINDVRKEVEDQKSELPLSEIKERVRDRPDCVDFDGSISRDPAGLIAEIKKKSPSMGKMAVARRGEIGKIQKLYSERPSVRAVSVLTNRLYFGGSPSLLTESKAQIPKKPILRKDFIFDEYQVWHAREMGADAILLMANVVEDAHRFADLHNLAKSLGLGVLCEVHTEAELARLPVSATVCGVNCRRFLAPKGKFTAAKFLKKFGKDITTDLTSFSLLNKIPSNLIKVAESGLTVNNIGEVLRKNPFHSALIGTSILQSTDPRREIEALEEAMENLDFQTAGTASLAQ